MRILNSIFTYIFCLLAGCQWLMAQSQQDSVQWYQLQIEKDLPLAEAAKNPAEVLFVANHRLDSLKHIATSVNVLLASDIKNAGAMNIPEALQLLPEFMVKAKSNGLYHVEYRGTSASYNQVGGTEHLLLLINAIPYNDALSGEIWWEALPYSIEDIDRIELIRSPQGTWFGYGGALAVINLVTKDPAHTQATHLSANLQTGLFNSHHYHLGISTQLNERLSARAGAFLQYRNRFQNDFYIRSLGRYLAKDSILFYQPEALRTNPSTSLSHNLRGINIGSSYRWHDSLYIRLEVANQQSEAQGAFNLQDEIRATTRTSETRLLNLHFAAPNFILHAFHLKGDLDYAKGYQGFKQQLAKKGLRAAYRKKLKHYYFSGGLEWTNNQYEALPTDIAGLMAMDSLRSVTALEESLFSVFLQQQLSLSKNRLLIESGQRLYHTYEGLDHPVAFHIALRWYLSTSTSVQVSAAQVLQESNRLFENRPNTPPLQLVNYQLSLNRDINNKQGKIRISLFNQQESQTEKRSFGSETPTLNLPVWGSTLEAHYDINRFSFNAHTSWFNSKQDGHKLHPSLIASLQVNYATYFDKLNFNAGAFYYGKHNNLVNDMLFNLPEQWLIHSKFSYRVWQDHELFLNIRNLLNYNRFVVPQADRDHRLLMLGLTISL